MVNGQIDALALSKALECCSGEKANVCHEGEDGCPYYERAMCSTEMCKEASKLIKNNAAMWTRLRTFLYSEREAESVKTKKKIYDTVLDFIDDMRSKSNG